MVRDAITDGIREIRRALAAKFGNDIRRIGAELRRQQTESDRTFVRLPSRKPRTSDATNEALQSRGE